MYKAKCTLKAQSYVETKNIVMQYFTESLHNLQCLQLAIWLKILF